MPYAIMNTLLSPLDFTNPIIHLDCNAFFTSVEEALHPELKGKPLVTGKERGIVACANYTAKALGVKRPMRLYEAKKICPELICLASDYETYSLFSKRIFSILRRFTPVVEEYSIDEAFAELSGLRRIHHKDYPEIARDIKMEVQKSLGLTVSVGLSSSKTLAKMASSQEKPDGFTVLKLNQLHEVLPFIKLDQVCGFGSNTVALLQKYGIKNVWDYVLRPEAWTKRLLGKIGVELWRELRGEVQYPLQTEPKTDYASISKFKTCTPSSSDEAIIFAQLVRNLESALIKARRYGFGAKGVVLYLRDQMFKTYGLEAQFDHSTSSIVEVVHLIRPLFKKLFDPKISYRATGVVLFKLESHTTVQYSLFDNIPKIESMKAIDRVIDQASERYGKHALHLGSGLWIRKPSTCRGDLPERKKNLLPGESFRSRLGIPMWNIALK